MTNLQQLNDPAVYITRQFRGRNSVDLHDKFCQGESGDFP